MSDADRHATLQAELNARTSIFHFAHAAVSLLVGSVAFATAGRLYWDHGFGELALLGAALIVGALMFVHGAVRWVLGRRQLRREDEQFAELKALREALRLDDPKNLLPQ